MTKIGSSYSAVLAAMLFSMSANADLIVTLTNDGSGGVIAKFEGRGQVIAGDTGFSTSQSIISRFTCEPLQPCDPFQGIESAYFDLATPIAIGSGYSLINIGIDDDGSDSCHIGATTPCLFNTDDLFLNFNNTIPVGTVFEFSAESQIPNLRFAVLRPGIYFPLLLRSATFGDTTLVISPIPVPEPGTLALLGLGIAGIGFAKLKKA